MTTPKFSLRRFLGTPVRAFRSYRQSGLPLAAYISILLWPRRSSVVRARTRLARYPLSVRADTSDLRVFQQIFVREEYRGLSRLKNPTTILDLGANVGFASAYFLTRFPAARVIAVEPDPQNFEMLRRNLQPYGDRAVCIHAGVWSSTCNLNIVDSRYRDGQHWSRQVTTASHDQADAIVPGVDVPWLMDRVGASRISLLKCDIEGAEVQVFGPSSAAWIDNVDAIAIELHDDSQFGNGTEVFTKAIAGLPFETTQSGEYRLCVRSDRDRANA